MTDEESDEQWDARIEKMTLSEMFAELDKLNKQLARVDAEISTLLPEAVYSKKAWLQ